MTKYRPRTKPFDHQSRATLRAVRQRNHAIFFEPRLGKSKAALDYVGVLALKGEVKRVCIFAPAIALGVWEDQIIEHFPFVAHVETFEEEWHIPRPAEGQWQHTTTEFFLAGREETFRATRKGRKLLRPKQKVIEEWNPDAVIIDESHEYKRPGGRAAQDAWRLVRRLRGKRGGDGRPYVLLLTGTPNPKGWRDLFAQFRIMDDSLLGTSAASFDEQHCVYGVGPRKYTIVSYRDTRRLKKTIRDHSTTCTATQAGLEGELFFQQLKVDLPPKIKEAYNEMVEEFATELGGEIVSAANIGVKRLRLLQITGGFTTSGKQIHSKKLEALRDWLRVLHDEGEHVIVASRYTPEVSACGLVAEAVGYHTAIISGATPKLDRRESIRAFQKATKPHALVFQVQAGSRAIELSNAAEVVFYSLPDGWVDFWQFLNRVRGPNQKRPVRISAVVARGTVDLSVLTSLRNKEDGHRELMRDPKRYLLGMI